jgi:hypothetical protein
MTRAIVGDVAAIEARAFGCAADVILRGFARVGPCAEPLLAACAVARRASATKDDARARYSV